MNSLMIKVFLIGFYITLLTRNIYTLLDVEAIIPTAPLCRLIQLQRQPYRPHGLLFSISKLDIQQQYQQSDHSTALHYHSIIRTRKIGIIISKSKHFIMNPNTDDIDHTNEIISSNNILPHQAQTHQLGESQACSNDTILPIISSNANSKVDSAIKFATLVGRLKRTPRTGWKIRHIPNYESVADHSWRVAILGLLLSSSIPVSASSDVSSINSTNIDVNKIIQLALIHDIAECIVGDITPEDVHISKHVKHQMEHDAVVHISKLLHNATATVSDNTIPNTNDVEDFETNTLLHLFHEYEERKTIESIIVKDLDMLDMILQAYEYEQEYCSNMKMDLSDFFIGTPPSKFQYPFLQEIAKQVHEQRNAFHLHSQNCDNSNDMHQQDQSSIVFSTSMINKSEKQDAILEEQLPTTAASDYQFVTEYYSQQSSPQQIPIKDIMKIVQSLRQWDKEHR